MELSCPYCSKRVFQVDIWRTYQVHLDVDRPQERCVREEVAAVRCASCGRIQPPGLWEKLKPAT